jgi:hypothetical protein
MYFWCLIKINPMFELKIWIGIWIGDLKKLKIWFLKMERMWIFHFLRTPPKWNVFPFGQIGGSMVMFSNVMSCAKQILTSLYKWIIIVNGQIWLWIPMMGNIKKLVYWRVFAYSFTWLSLDKSRHNPWNNHMIFKSNYLTSFSYLLTWICKGKINMCLFMSMIFILI